MKLKYGELRYSQYLETPKRYSIHSNITLLLESEIYLFRFRNPPRK